MQLQLQKYLPREELRPYIRFLYTIETEAGEGEIALQNHPQGAVDLILILEGKLGFSPGKADESVLREMILVGQQEQRFTFRFLPQMRVLGVTFTPEGFGKIFQLQASDLTNAGVNALDLLAKEDRFLLEKIAEMKNDRARILLLCDIFARMIYANDIPFDRVDGAVQALRQSGGQISIRELADAFSMSPRTLQRKFAAKIGVSPKTFARITRFNYLLRLLKQQPQAEWMDLLHASGYYDQMHFIKEFKHFTGLTPSAYREERKDLSDFFLEGE